MIARTNDPIWQKWYAPSGYMCRCRIVSVSDRQAPQFQRADAKRMQDPEAAAARQAAQPDPGWDYNVGEAPTKGIEQAVARKRQECGSTQLARGSRGGKLWCQNKDFADGLAMIEAVGKSGGAMPEPRRLDIPLLPSGRDERFYLERFMYEFGEVHDGTAILRDKTRTADLAVSRSLFVDHKTGKTKIDKAGRNAYLLYLAKTISDPDEQWLQEGGHADRALYLLARFILKAGVLNTLAVFKEEGKIWSGVTAYQTFDSVYFSGKRRDKRLVYMRAKEV